MNKTLTKLYQSPPKYQYVSLQKHRDIHCGIILNVLNGHIHSTSLLPEIVIYQLYDTDTVNNRYREIKGIDK